MNEKRARVEKALSVFMISCLYLFVIKSNQCDSHVITTNKMRYSTSEVDKMASSESFPSHIIQHMKPVALFDSNNDYKINQLKSGTESNEQHSNSIYELDNEDKSLLDKFYRETRGQDPLLGDSLLPEKLWDESDEDELKKLNAMLDLNPLKQQQDHLGQLLQENKDDWTIDKELVEQSKMLSSIQDMLPMAGDNHAHYSPSLKLLTSYNPISSAHKILDGQERSLRGNRIVGATLYGRNEKTKPNVSSKSPIEAIKLHDDLMKDPPHDGKVRVRMYFHRAIHDDAKLYGTGPWRYWGHGWGVEFGYDPRMLHNKDVYQRGYTIERAFGRDFCKDPKNCRPPDPNFFKGALKRVNEHNHEKPQPEIEIKPLFVDEIKSRRKNNLLQVRRR